MAISRLTTLSENKIGSSTTNGSFTHTADAGTKLILLTICTEGTESLSSAPVWDSAGDNQAFTLIHATADSGSRSDVRTHSYGLVTPTTTGSAKTITITFTSNIDPGWCAAVNYGGTIDNSSVAAAASFLFSDINDSASSSTDLHATGPETNTVCFGAFQGADGNPASDPTINGFTKVFRDETGASNSSDFAYFMYANGSTGSTNFSYPWDASDENCGQRLQLNEAPVTEQDHWRWYDDDNTDADATTALAAEDTTYEIPTASLDSSIHLRVGYSNTGGGPSTDTFTIAYKVDAGSWETIDNSLGDSLPVKMKPGQPTMPDPTSQRLTAGTGTWDSGVYIEPTANGSVADLAAGDFTEDVYSIQFRSAYLSGGESIEFRIQSLTSDLDVINQTIVCTIESSGTPATANPTGAEISGDAGTVTAEAGVSQDITGAEISGDAGTVTGHGDANYTVTGAEISGDAGTSTSEVST